jgi:hypothetical protein
MIREMLDLSEAGLQGCMAHTSGKIGTNPTRARRCDVRYRRLQGAIGAFPGSLKEFFFGKIVTVGIPLLESPP